MTRPIPLADIAIVARVLADLLESGLPLPRALAALEHLAPPSWQSHLGGIASEVRAGASLSSAFESRQGAVPSVMVSIVHAGEVGGGLAPALRSAADDFEIAATARASLISSLTYPAFLLTACVGSIVLLVGVVLPRFATMLADLSVSLPWTTAAVLNASHVFRVAAPYTLVTLAAGGVVLWRWQATAEGRVRRDSLLLNVPVLGDARHAWASASVCATTGTLLTAGVPLPIAFQQGGNVSNDAAVRERTSAARAGLLSGSRLSDALESRQALSATCIRLIRAGEESGRLALMMDRAARIERDRAIRITQRAARLLEPVLVVGFGGLVALVAASLLQAVYAVRPGP